MYILHKTRQRSGGYARTFLRQLEDVLPTCVERGITVVSNAGGLDPAGWRRGARSWPGARASRSRWPPSRATTSPPRWTNSAAGGERFVNLDTGEALPAGAPVVTANAYLARRPIADALAAGRPGGRDRPGHRRRARRGPGAPCLRLADDDLDAIAGAVVAGHVIECGAQCCGGNYAFFEEIPGPRAHRLPAGRAARRRLVGHNQAPRHRGCGHGRHGDGAAALRNRGPPLPEPRRGGPLRQHRAGPGGRPTGCASRACAASRRRRR